MTELHTIMQGLQLVLYGWFWGFLPLILLVATGYAAYGWATGRGPLSRERLVRAAQVTSKAASSTYTGGVTIAKSPAAAAAAAAGVTVLPYAVAGLGGLALLALFPIPTMLAGVAYGLWAAKGYDRLLFVLLLVAALTNSEDAATIVIFATLGVGIPLLFSATALAYGLCLRSAVKAWSQPSSQNLAPFAVSGALVLAMAVMPGFIGRMQGILGARSFSARDHVPAKPPAITSLEIRRPQSVNDSTFDGVAACGAECRAVLATGRVGWVRVVMLESRGTKSKVSRTFHRPTGADTAMADDTHEVADLVLTFDDVEYPKRGYFDLAEWSTIWVATGSRVEGGKRVEVYRQTGAAVDYPVIPMLIGPGHKGLQFMRSNTDQSHAVTLRKTLNALGLLSAGAAAVAPPRSDKDPITGAMTREVVSVLDLKQTSAFNLDQSRVVSQWLSAARNVTQWQPDDLAVLRRILFERRLRVPTNFDQLFERDRGLTQALMPDVLSLLEAHGVSTEYTPERQAAYTFNRIDPALLLPYAPRIFALLAKDRDVEGVLLPAVGRLGVDPAPFLLPLAKDIGGKAYGGFSSGYAHLKGACFAEQRWAASLIPNLHDALATNAAQPKPDITFDRGVLQTLATLGDIDFVRATLAQRGDNDAQRLAKRIDQSLARTGNATSLCWDW